MARPYLKAPAGWISANLEPSPSNPLIAKVSGGSTPLTSAEEYWNGDIPWLTPKEIAGDWQGLFVSDTERRITELGLRSCGTVLLSPGTVMLTKRAPVGVVAVNAVPMTTNQGFLNFTCRPAIRPLYLAYWLRANRPYLDLVANGSTYPELYLSDLFEFRISVPDVDFQDRIISIVNSVRFIALLGQPLEQTAREPSVVPTIQAQDGRLVAVLDELLPLLLSGDVAPEEAAAALFNGDYAIDTLASSVRDRRVSVDCRPPENSRTAAQLSLGFPGDHR